MGIDNIKLSKPEHAKWQVVERAEDKFVVYAPDGQVHGTYATKSQAAGIAGRWKKEADEAARKMVRPCICCGTDFDSQGIHNRLCCICRHRDGGQNPHGIAPRSGRPK